MLSAEAKRQGVYVLSDVIAEGGLGAVPETAVD